MPATRLLVIADSKMLPALANGLRDGARFDVLTVPLSDPARAQAAAEKADAVALFYGAPGTPLPAALQVISAKLRDRGGRLVAVLQRDQAALRDECFRAGASDLLFMPMPKEQFVARLQSALDLTWEAEAGARAPVSVATRTSSSKVDQATISVCGVEVASELPLKAGETVRLSWGNFQSWGLVVKGGPPARIRFAGLAPDEEAQIRDWLKSGPQPASGPAAPAGKSERATGTPTPPGGFAPVAAASAGIAAAQETAKPPGGSAAVAATSTAPAAAEETPAPPEGSAPVAATSTGPAPAEETLTPPEGSAPAAPEEGPAVARAAPTAGPPPGFADRKPVRPQKRGPARVGPPVMIAPGGASAAAAAGPAPAPAMASGGPAVSGAAPPSRTPAADPALSSLFEEGAAAPAAAGSPEAGPGPAPAGPPWPVPVPLAACKAAAAQFLKDKTVPADAPAALAYSTRKITGMLGSAERVAFEKGGLDSSFAESLAARIALDTATSEGVRLFTGALAASLDPAAVTALTRISDDAAARLQKEANAAAGKGEAESLQMITAASAALSRDQLRFKETADRLRGLSAARKGAGALDPDLVLPGQAPRPAASKAASAAPQVRAELRDFQSLDRPARAKTVLMIMALAAFVAALGNAVYFSVPHYSALSPQAAGAGIERIDVAGESALVTVTPEWLLRGETGLPQLVSALREGGVKKAVLILPNGSPAGVVDVASGKAGGLAKPKAAAPN